MNTKILVATAAIAASLGAGSQARANPTLFLQISDGNPGDTVATNDSAVAGQADYSGGVGSIFTTNVVAGHSKPLIGAVSRPNVDLTSVDITSGNGGGTLTLKLSAIGFTSLGQVIAALGSLGGTTEGTVSFTSYWSQSNTAFATTNLLTSSGPLSGASGGKTFSSDITSSAFTANGPFSMTEVVTVAQGAKTVSSFDAELDVDPVPEPASMTLLGAGLVGLGFVRRRRA